MNRKIISLALIPTFIVFSGCSQNNRTLEQKLQSALLDNLESYNVKGASLTIIFSNQKIITVTAGFSHDTVKIKPDMFFATGSITKNVVATLTFKLAEQGLLSIDDSISKWLPKYKYVDSTITIRQLLHHESGLYMFWENQKLWDDLIKYRDSVFSPEVVLSYIKEPYFKPGEGFRYSNTNYLLLVLIIKKATGSNLSSEFRKLLFEPLNLKEVYLSQEDELPTNLAHVWGDNFEKDGSFRDITFLPRVSHESITYGSSGIFITAKDLAFWCNSLFNGRVLEKSSMKQMLDFNKDGYGLGVHLFNKSITDGEIIYGHGGANIGTCAYMAYLPEYKVSIVLMINAFIGDCLDNTLEDVIEIVVDNINTK
jgi:D-alanyl-D-alanine carboxypeptidase